MPQHPLAPPAPSQYPVATAGECTARCVCCDALVMVPKAAGIGPWLTHRPERGTGNVCPRTGWPISDAIRADD